MDSSPLAHSILDDSNDIEIIAVFPPNPVAFLDERRMSLLPTFPTFHDRGHEQLLRANIPRTCV